MTSPWDAVRWLASAGDRLALRGRVQPGGGGEAEVEGGQEEERGQRRGDQAAEHDDRHRADDLVARDVAWKGSGEGGERERRGRIEDRREPFLAAARRGPEPRRLAVTLEGLQ